MGLLVQPRIAKTREVVTMIGVIYAGLAYAASMVSSMPLAPIITDPTMKDWPGSRRTMELGKRIIWFAMDSTCTPPTWHATVDEILLAIYRGICPQ
jgi:hypothetical protein